MKTMLRRWMYRAALEAACVGAAIHGKHFSLGVLKLDRIGDGVLAIGAVRRLLRDFAEAETLLIVSQMAEPLFRSEFPRAGFLVLPPFSHSFAPNYLSFLLRHAAELRRLKVDRLVCLRHQPSDYLHSIARMLQPSLTLASAVAAPWERVGLTYPHPRLVDYPAQAEVPCLEIEAHRRVVELAVGEPVTKEEILPALHSVQPAEGDSLLLCPDAGDPLRIYPSARLAEAVRHFLAAHRMPVELCLPPSVPEEPWREVFRDIEVRRWHRPNDALELARVIASAGVVLANETAPAHLATALDKRGVFLLGGGHFGLLAPWSKSERQRWVYYRVDCYGCRWHCIYPEPLCITELAPRQIAETLGKVLQS